MQSDISTSLCVKQPSKAQMRHFFRPPPALALNSRWSDHNFIEGREEGREEGKALTVIELLKDGDISFEKAQQRIDKLKSKSPDSDFWVSIYKSLQSLNPNSTKGNEPATSYKAPRQKRPARK